MQQRNKNFMTEQHITSMEILHSSCFYLRKLSVNYGVSDLLIWLYFGSKELCQKTNAWSSLEKLKVYPNNHLSWKIKLLGTNENSFIRNLDRKSNYPGVHTDETQGISAKSYVVPVKRYCHLSNALLLSKEL